MNLSVKQKQTHRCRNRLLVAKGHGGGGGTGWEFEVSRCRFLHLEWIRSKVPLCSTKNCILSVVNYDGKEHIYTIQIHAIVLYS